MKKGAEDRIRVRSDLYSLPSELISARGQFDRDDKSLLRVLHEKFAVQFYRIGILKLISDLASLATPLLLNELLLFLDDSDVPMTRGYLCAGGIFLASVIGSFVNSVALLPELIEDGEYHGIARSVFQVRCASFISTS